VQVLLRQGDLAGAAQLAQQRGPALSQARVHLAHGDTSAALALLDRQGEQWQAKGWPDEQLKGLVLQAVAHHAQDDMPAALIPLQQALVLAEPEGHIRMFLDEGSPMAALLREATAHGIIQGYAGKLLAAFEAKEQRNAGESLVLTIPASQPLIEPLSHRELELLRLLKTDLSGPEIANQLMIALSTVRTHTKSIYSKLNVKNRRAAVKRATELGLI
jgi:LuxR family maltose regulon positive regulatory protein